MSPPKFMSPSKRSPSGRVGSPVVGTPLVVGHKSPPVHTLRRVKTSPNECSDEEEEEEVVIESKDVVTQWSEKIREYHKDIPVSALCKEKKSNSKTATEDPHTYEGGASRVINTFDGTTLTFGWVDNMRDASGKVRKDSKMAAYGCRTEGLARYLDDRHGKIYGVLSIYVPVLLKAGDTELTSVQFHILNWSILIIDEFEPYLLYQEETVLRANRPFAAATLKRFEAKLDEDEPLTDQEQQIFVSLMVHYGICKGSDGKKIRGKIDLLLGRANAKLLLPALEGKVVRRTPTRSTAPRWPHAHAHARLSS